MDFSLDSKNPYYKVKRKRSILSMDGLENGVVKIQDWFKISDLFPKSWFTKER